MTRYKNPTLAYFHCETIYTKKERRRRRRRGGGGGRAIGKEIERVKKIK
jgi:hypothetical protein